MKQILAELEQLEAARQEPERRWWCAAASHRATPAISAPLIVGVTVEYCRGGAVRRSFCGQVPPRRSKTTDGAPACHRHRNREQARQDAEAGAHRPAE